MVAPRPTTLALCPECGGEGGFLNMTVDGDYGMECETCGGTGTIKVYVSDPHVIMRKKPADE